MVNLGKMYLYRMVHIGNIPFILGNGLTHSNSENRNPGFIPIGDQSLINSRNAFQMPNGNLLGDYIPFYFGPRMPMLYVIQKGKNGVAITNPSEIVYCITTVNEIIHHQLDFVFTDGHAVAGLSEFYYPSDINHISTIVDFKAVKSQYWIDENDTDLKRRKEAEFLVFGDIPAEAIKGYIVYDEAAREKMLDYGVEEHRVIVKTLYYF